MKLLFVLKKYLSFVCAILVSVALVFSAYYVTRDDVAAQAVGIRPLGGRITYVEYCCNGLKLHIGPPTPGVFFIDWASLSNPFVVYREYQTYYGGSQWSVGTALPFAVCVHISSECESADYPTGGSINLIGTAFPG